MGESSERMITKYWEKMECPYCHKKEGDLWYNNVPLRAYCLGTDKKPHKEWSKICINNIY